MSNVTLNINGETHTLDVTPDMPLLWALRDKLNMTGTKYSCGVGICGTCTVLVNGMPMRSCVMPAISMAGMEITTIEGLDPAGNHPVQKAWNEEDVPQCGYCQGGQILTASALLKRNPNPSDQDIDAAMSGVLCRCGTYHRIRKAIKLAAKYSAVKGVLHEEPGEQRKGMDRRSFLKVSMLASGALIVGVGYDGTLRAGELSGETWEPNLYVRINADGNDHHREQEPGSGAGCENGFSNGGRGMPECRLEERQRRTGAARRPLWPAGYRWQPGYTRWLGRPAHRGNRSRVSLLMAAAASEWGVAAYRVRSQRRGGHARGLRSDPGATRRC